MNTEDDGARNGADHGDAEHPQPNGADQDAGSEHVEGAATPPPEPPVEPPPVDQPSAEQLNAENAENAEPAEPAEPEETATADDAATDAESHADTGTGSSSGAAADAGSSGTSGSGPGTDEYARRFLDSVDGFLGNVFKEASEFVDRTARRTPPPRAERERQAPEDYAAGVLDSVEGWMSDFFRGASMARTAAGFGRAATGSAFRARQRAEDVWAQATSPHDSDASRECRYCPFCQTMAVVRNSRPELYEQIGDTAKRLVDLMRQAAEQSRRPRR